MFKINPMRIFWIAAHSSEDMQRYRAYHNTISVSIDHFYAQYDDARVIVNLHPKFDFYPSNRAEMSVFCDVDISDHQVLFSVEPMFRQQAFVHCFDETQLLKTKLRLS